MYTRWQVREVYQWVPAALSAWRPPKDMTASDLVLLITSATADISIETYRRLYETAAISLSRSGYSAYDIARFQAALDALRAHEHAQLQQQPRGASSPPPQSDAAEAILGPATSADAAAAETGPEEAAAAPALTADPALEGTPHGQCSYYCISLDLRLYHCPRILAINYQGLLALTLHLPS